MQRASERLSEAAVAAVFGVDVSAGVFGGDVSAGVFGGDVSVERGSWGGRTHYSKVWCFHTHTYIHYKCTAILYACCLELCPLQQVLCFCPTVHTA